MIKSDSIIESFNKKFINLNLESFIQNGADFGELLQLLMQLISDVKPILNEDKNVSLSISSKEFPKKLINLKEPLKGEEIVKDEYLEEPLEKLSKDKGIYPDLMIIVETERNQEKKTLFFTNPELKEKNCSKFCLSQINDEFEKTLSFSKSQIKDEFEKKIEYKKSLEKTIKIDFAPKEINVEKEKLFMFKQVEKNIDYKKVFQNGKRYTSPKSLIFSLNKENIENLPQNKVIIHNIIHCLKQPKLKIKQENIYPINLENQTATINEKESIEKNTIKLIFPQLEIEEMPKKLKEVSKLKIDENKEQKPVIGNLFNTDIKKEVEKVQILKMNRPPIKIDQDAIIEQIVKKIEVQFQNEKQEIIVDLKPEVLGKLKIHISIDKGTLKVHFFTNTYIVKEVIEKGLEMLKQSFGQQGFLISEFNVSLANEHSEFYMPRNERQLPQTYKKEKREKVEIIKPKISKNLSISSKSIDFWA